MRLTISLFMLGAYVTNIEISAIETYQGSQSKLLKELLSGYDLQARPVANPNHNILVEVGFHPLHIASLDENRGILTIDCWMYMKWKDYFMKWNPADFEGIKELRIDQNKLWKPDITVGEKHGGLGNWRPCSLIVDHMGTVFWIPTATIEAVCGRMDYSNYPQDTQSCILTLLAANDNINFIDLKLHKENLTTYDFDISNNPHWKYLGTTARRMEVIYAEYDPLPYVELKYEVMMRRENVPYSSLSTVPDTIARVLILCMFWLTNPSRKFLFGCTSLLMLTIIASNITSSLPSPAAAPAALSKISATMALCITAIIVELVAAALYDCQYRSPNCLDSLANSTICRLLAPCNEGPALSREFQPEGSDDVIIPRRVSQWPLLATLVDRVAFVVFAVLLLAF